MAFLSDLGNIINEQFSFGENNLRNLDAGGDRIGNFGLLGKFAKKIDRTAERTYIEDGLINNIRPRLREVLFQEPDLTIVLKKRMFSSLIENDRLDLLEEKERILIRATKRLFQNKCNLMSAYERLTKVERVTQQFGHFNTSLIPIVLQSIEEFERSGLGFNIDPETRAAIETLRQAINFSEASIFTNWTVDYETIFPGPLGDGTGTIELTTVASLNTNISNNFGSGSCNFTIEDPYKIFHVTNEDIDRAISEANNFYNNSPFGRFTEIELRNLINNLKNQLTQQRSSRGASNIRFILSPQTLISKRVRAIMEAEGRELNFNYNSGLVGLGDSVDIDSKEFEGKNGLLPNEARLFREIISNIFLLLGFENTTQSQIKEFNKELNYVRNRMRLFFGKKSVIQVMDVVNVFISSKTLEDSKLTVGFPGFQATGGRVLGQTINNLVRNINATLQDLSGTRASPDDFEKAAIVGPNFPTWLWKIFRNNFTKQAAGTSVFVGLVKGVEQNYSNGKYTINVSCEDNASYFTKSQINLKPALDVFNSSLYDPLTPFDVSFDAATGKPINDVQDGAFPPLLSENMQLLETRALKFKTTDFRGQKANQVLYRTKKGEIVFGRLRKVLADADGFVYRWKQGIQSLTKIERANPESLIQDERSPLLTKDPFAGQDVMNVLSLLITGQPYNYNTFLKAALSNANDILAYDPAQNVDTHASYLDGLLNDLSNRNVIWGNFVPFKGLSVNEAAFKFLRKGQADLTKRQSRLQQLLRERASLLDQRALESVGFANNPQQYARDAGGNLQPPPVGSDANSAKIVGLDARISELDVEIEKSEIEFSEENAKLYVSNVGNINIIGDDISLEPGFSNFDGSTAVNNEQQSLSRAEFRRQINTLALRRLWKVKANSDVNLFIVDDQYDKNYDIQAFERRIDGALELFNSEYTTVDIQIKAVAEILGLEVFADSQGHIRVRPPLYNRMPSSVFYKMFRERDESGVKVFPDFLENLLFNQVRGLVDRIEIVEDEIRLRAVAIGVFGNDGTQTDNEIKRFLRGNQTQGRSNYGFSFITDPDTGKIVGESFNTLSNQSNPDLIENNNNSTIIALEELNNRAGNQLNATRIFDISIRAGEVRKRNFAESFAKVTTNSRLDIIRSRLLKNKGIKAPTLSDLFSNDRFRKSVPGGVSELDALNVIQQISNLVEERQRLVRELSNSTKHLIEGLQINENDEGANQALNPFLNQRDGDGMATSVPSFLEHMIQDELLDDFGPQSGLRFVIKEAQIINLKITESPPPYTTIQVNGLFAEGFTDPPTQLNANLSGTSGGNAVTSAYAVDYDLWRQYGFRVSNSIPARFFSDPDSQCAPYAVALLNLARKNIFTGSVTIAGRNEFYQVGDVIYLEDYDLLFYVNGVSHSFAFESGLTTTLSLTYGHNPGEYIPTPLDIIGKYLYNAQTFSEQFRSARFSVDGDDINIGVVVVDPGNATLDDVLAGSRGKQNRSILGKVLFGASGALNPVAVRNVQPILQLRIYADGDNPEFHMPGLAENIKDYLVNPQNFSSLNQELLGSTGVENNFKISRNLINVEIIDINNDIRSPSSAAWNSVRDIQASGSFSFAAVTGQVADASALDNILLNSIIDIWLTFENVEESTASNDQTNQFAQEANAAISEATS